MKIRFIFSVLFILIGFVFAQSNWYVGLEGTDASGKGTSPADPFRTAAYAAEQASPGDSILILGGTYTNANYNNGDYWTDEKTESISELHGSAGNYIVIKAYQNQEVVYRGDALYIFHLRNSSYVRVEGIEVEGEVERIPFDSALAYQFAYKNAGGEIMYRVPPGTPDSEVENMTFEVLDVAERPTYFGTKGLLVQNSHHIDIINNHIHHVPGTGLRFNGCDYINVIGNEIHGCSRRSSVGTHGFVFDGSGSIDNSNETKIYIARNHVHHNYNEIYSWNSGKTFITPLIDEGKGISMQRNDAEHGWTHGRIRIENNIAHHNGFSGIHSNSGERMDFVNNTAFYNSHSGRGNNIGISVSGSDDISIINNISVADNSFGGSALSASSSTNLTVSNNLVVGDIDAEIDAIDENTITGDPFFADTANYDFSILSGSPAIGQALVSAAPDSDYYGNVRDDQPDIGAAENVVGSEIAAVPAAVVNREQLKVNSCGKSIVIVPISAGLSPVKIYDVQGRLLSRFEIDGTRKITWRAKAAGAYFVKSSGQTKRIVLR